jgi:hypothetical protein
MVICDSSSCTGASRFCVILLTSRDALVHSGCTSYGIFVPRSKAPALLLLVYLLSWPLLVDIESLLQSV